MELLDSNSIISYKEKLLGLFGKFIDFCDEYSLTYYCTGGTMLGAVRHHGFIPWDDDIDLFMMRDDYNKLISLQSELQKRGIRMEGLQSQDKFAVFLKLWDTGTTLWEIEEIPFVYGIFIDIFPLDYSDDSQEQFLSKYMKRRRLYILYQLSQMRFSVHAILSRIKQKDKKFIFRDFLSLFVPAFLQGYIRNLLIREDEKGWKQQGCFLASYYGDYFEREFLKKEWFDDYILVDFEKLKVKIPKGYDGYLSQIYHDYMKLPPKEKQISHHYHYYLNLDQHYNMEQIKLLIKKK